MVSQRSIKNPLELRGSSECVKSELGEDKNLEGPYKRTQEIVLMSDQNLKVVWIRPPNTLN